MKGSKYNKNRPYQVPKTPMITACGSPGNGGVGPQPEDASYIQSVSTLSLDFPISTNVTMDRGTPRGYQTKLGVATCLLLSRLWPCAQGTLGITWPEHFL